ncbi:hypothetical protein J4G48_0048890 (plasmid) [Bradyrhizobium barranii subsp. apii]|uniref:hypothetical protein n=1 Tax=Bradyrhizobium barranii TaxID=2992140 RepID=UPI001CD7CA1A|nr:hypothetical protein [Bradyrhizobium barranii]UPU01356.1 hypothetical protein J4G48_0048890 [Bradyrhizobium barranii subsp. apii]
MPAVDDLSRSLTALNQDSTLMTVIEMSKSSWLVAGMVPGIERHPMKKLDPDPVALLNLVSRWRCEAERKQRRIDRSVSQTRQKCLTSANLARLIRERAPERLASVV